MDKWISAEDKTAPFAVDVLVFDCDKIIRIDMMVPSGSYSTYWSGCIYKNKPKPTHWMPLPEPPETT